MKKSNQFHDYQKITEFHGHQCPGTAIGFRAGEIAIKELSTNRAVDEEFLAIVENDSCSVDAIQVVTGCTTGKGNLIFKDYGKQVYTFMNRNTGNGIRISLKIDLETVNPHFHEARMKAFSSTADEADKKEFEKQKDVLNRKILEMPGEDLFKIGIVEMELPEKARIYQTIKCTECGDMVSEHRARVKDGKIVCIPCFED
jgi:formylmethanofuran dehydrogenase subunit E